MKKFKTYSLIILFFTIVAIGLFLVLEIFVEPKATNLLTKISPPKAQDNVVLVMIDQKSIDKIRFPWKRKLYANIIEYINDNSSAKVIAFDSLISSPDLDFPESDEYFFKTISKYDNFIGAFNTDLNVPEQSTLNKDLFDLISNKSAITVKYSINMPASPLQNILKMRPKYIESAKSFGCVATPHDYDTYIRSAIPIIRIAGNNYPMLAFAAYMKAKNTDSFVVTDKYLCSDDNCKTLKVRVKNTILGPQMDIK